MATMEELLAQASDGSTDSAGRPLAVSEDFRTVSVPEGERVLGARGDHDTRRVHFDCPRFCDGTDMAGYAFSVMYRNALGKENRYMVSDVEAGEDRLSFSWLVARDACAARGTVTASVNARMVDGDARIVNEFNTTTFEMTVLEDVQAKSTEVASRKSEVDGWIAGWRSDVEAMRSDVDGAVSQAQDATSGADTAASDARDAATSAGEAAEVANAASAAAQAATAKANDAAAKAGDKADAAAMAAGRANSAADEANEFLRNFTVEYGDLSEECKAYIAQSASAGVELATDEDVEHAFSEIVAPAIEGGSESGRVTQEDYERALGIIFG